MRCEAMSIKHRSGPCVRDVNHLDNDRIHRDATGDAWGYRDLELHWLVNHAKG